MSFSDKAVIDGRGLDHRIRLSHRAFRTTSAALIRSISPSSGNRSGSARWQRVLCLLTAYPIAFGICFAPERWKPLLLLLVILPFWINLLIRTYALIAVFRSQGYVNLALGTVGLGPYRHALQ